MKKLRCELGGSGCRHMRLRSVSVQWRLAKAPAVMEPAVRSQLLKGIAPPCRGSAMSWDARAAHQGIWSMQAALRVAWLLLCGMVKLPMVMLLVS